jgi:uncharacterized protein (DUF433 family)
MILPDFLTLHKYGEISLTGHRIGLFTVVRDYQEGSSAEQIAEEYPTLSLELIQKVLDFYQANRKEVDEYVTSYQAEIDRQASAPPGPGVLRIRELLRSKQTMDKP